MGQSPAVGRRRNRVETARVEGMAARNPPHREPRAAQGPVLANCLKCISTARWREPAVRPQQGTDEPPVPGNQGCEHAGAGGELHLRLPTARVRPHRNTPACRRTSVLNTRSSSAAISAWRAVAACGCARTTSRLPPGKDGRYPRTSERRRRRTLFLVTALPTDLLTTKPTRGGSSPASARTSKWPVSNARLARPPRRTAAVKSADRRIRNSAGSTRPPLLTRDARVTR
jgi:hypothetical protein